MAAGGLRSISKSNKRGSSRPACTRAPKTGEARGFGVKEGIPGLPVPRFPKAVWSATRFASSTPGVKRGFSACLYQGPRNWVVQGLLQGACQNLQFVPKNFARKRKAPEYGALVFFGFNVFSIAQVFQALGQCPMLVHGALKQCTVLKRCGDPKL